MAHAIRRSITRYYVSGFLLYLCFMRPVNKKGRYLVHSTRAIHRKHAFEYTNYNEAFDFFHSAVINAIGFGGKKKDIIISIAKQNTINDELSIIAKVTINWDLKNFN